MAFAQILTLLVLAGGVAALIFGKMRADVVALAGAAFLLMTGVVRPGDPLLASGLAWPDGDGCRLAHRAERTPPGRCPGGPG